MKEVHAGNPFQVDGHSSPAIAKLTERTRSDLQKGAFRPCSQDVTDDRRKPPTPSPPPTNRKPSLASLAVASSQAHPFSLHHCSTCKRLGRTGSSITNAEEEPGQEEGLGDGCDAAHWIILLTGTRACA